MGGRLLEKTYNSSKNQNLCTQLRRQKEELWIQKLGTAIPLGSNDKINIIYNLYSTRCSNVNVMNIFDNTTVVLDVNGLMATVSAHHIETT